MVQTHAYHKAYAVARRLQRHVRPRTGTRPRPVPPHARWPRVRDAGQGRVRASRRGSRRPSRSAVLAGRRLLSWTVAVWAAPGRGVAVPPCLGCLLSWVFVVLDVYCLGGSLSWLSPVVDGACLEVACVFSCLGGLPHARRA